MVEKDEIKPAVSMKERLKKGLDDSRQVGFITYCITAQKNIPPEIKTKFIILPCGELSQEDIKSELQKGYVRMGTQQLDYRFKISDLNPQSILPVYLKILKDSFREMTKAKKSIKGKPKLLLSKFPELKGDNLFDQYWPDVFPFISREDKAYHQYTITHLRATILGFSQAAERFGDEEIGKNAFDLQNKFKDNKRVDPLEIAELIKVNLKTRE